ncbi:MAG: aminopeptidase P family protein [Deltaproteobacteria bacterium]|nr:MAG: aminopeptidase P family protein [Deltaproteobacteria bacterium]
MKKKKLDCLLITSLPNLRYLSGFSGSSGALLINRDDGYFLADSRYYSQARKETKGFIIREYRKIIEGIAELSRAAGMKRMGFEAGDLTYKDYQKLQELLAKVKLLPFSKELDSLRAVKDRDEINSIKNAARIAAQCFLELKDTIQPGSRERNLAIELEYKLKKGGSGELPFDIIVASGPRGALPHGVASEKKIRNGEMVVIDYGSRYKGYFSDETCTLLMGIPTRKQKNIYQIVKAAHDKAIDFIRPGKRASQIDKVAREYIRQAGYSRGFGHALGHGVGLAIHEEPLISPDSSTLIEEGMVFTIEPGIYLEGWGGVRIEDMIVVTRDGCKVLTQVSKEMECCSPPVLKG